MHSSTFSFFCHCTTLVHRYTYIVKLARDPDSHSSSNYAECIHCVNLGTHQTDPQPVRLKQEGE